MSIAYTYVIIDNTTGTDVYVGSSKKQNRLMYHERIENNTCSSKQIILNGDYHFEIIKTFDGDISDVGLRKKEQALMNRMRKVYKMNVINQVTAYISEYHIKQKDQRRRNANKLNKRNYDLKRNAWRYTWEENSRDIGSFNNISWDVFQ